MSKARQSTRQRYRKPRMEYSEGSRVGFQEGSGPSGSSGQKAHEEKKREETIKRGIFGGIGRKQRRANRMARRANRSWYLGKNLGRADPSTAAGQPYIPPMYSAPESKRSVRKFLNRMVGTDLPEGTPVRDWVAERPTPVIDYFKNNQPLRSLLRGAANYIPGGKETAGFFETYKPIRSLYDFATPEMWIGKDRRGPIQSTVRGLGNIYGHLNNRDTREFENTGGRINARVGFYNTSTGFEDNEGDIKGGQANKKKTQTSNTTQQTQKTTASGQTTPSGQEQNENAELEVWDGVSKPTRSMFPNNSKGEENFNAAKSYWNSQQVKKNTSTTENQTTENQTTENQTTENQTTENQTTENQTTENQTATSDDISSHTETTQVPVLDEDGNPVKDENGNIVTKDAPKTQIQKETQAALEGKLPDTTKADVAVLNQEPVYNEDGTLKKDAQGNQVYQTIEDTDPVQMAKTKRTPKENRSAWNDSPKTGLGNIVDNAMYTASDGQVFSSNAEGKLYEKFLEETQGKDIAAASQAGAVTDETVTTGTSTTAQAQEDIDAATYTADEVSEDADVTAAQGTVGDKSTVDVDKVKVDDVSPITAAKVDKEFRSTDPEENAALVKQLQGTLSADAKVKAVKVAGLSERKITRYKKQLRSAGLSEEEIKEIGNDPEALEDRVLDFTEEERGIIEGLPEEALVSTQIEGLLEGMEKGEVPAWANPAVAAVNQMLAARGMSASTVGRDALFNAIIQSAMPIAQSNAQAIQASVAQSKNIEAQESLKNAEMAQQRATQNASQVFQMDMANFSAEQQRLVTNAKFFQTVALTETNNRQQAAVQDAMIQSQINIAEADMKTKARINNANAFLQMDMANLSNEQQANVLEAQIENQRILSNQSAVNAAKQFNATSENQTNQFMASLNQQIEINNATRNDDMQKFNANSKNAAEARRTARDADLEKFNAQMRQDIDKANAEYSFRRESWNATNAATVNAANVAWRRRSNEVNTATQNAVNMQNAMNSFKMSSSAMAFLWQEQRDQADHDWKSYEASEQRKASVVIAALGAGSGTYDSKHWEPGFNNTLMKALTGLGIDHSLTEQEYS